MAEYSTEQNLRLSQMLLDRQGQLNRAKAEVKHWHDTYQQSANATDEFLGELLELLPGTEDTGSDAYDQIPRGIKALRAEVERLRALPAAWTKAAAEQQSIAHGEVPDLPRDLALVARGRARQLEDCAAELTTALAEEQNGGERP